MPIPRARIRSASLFVLQRKDLAVGSQLGLIDLDVELFLDVRQENTL
jgi:hypothetical protein